jgi:CheY-like chemotaxis protein
MSEEQERMIVVEDSLPNRKILIHLLEKLNYKVDAFEDGKQAWDFISSDDCKDFAVIISDIMMPNMDGVQLLKNIRESKFKNKPVVLVTAVSDREYIIEAKKLNVNGYILKPVTLQRITGKLEELFPDKKFPKFAA